ncbi:MAG: biotin/lipoyl-containing protein [Candidatus Limnocylindria bacterium]
MSRYEVRIDGQPAVPAEEWRLEPAGRDPRVALLTDGREARLVAVEGEGSAWFVTLRGRRIPVGVLSWRERVIADAEKAARAHGGPLEVKATLPGLIVAISVEEGDEVAEGDPLLTIEAMKMQNEVRAPRAGRVAQIGVSPGETVATGRQLLRLE